MTLGNGWTNGFWERECHIFYIVLSQCLKVKTSSTTPSYNGKIPLQIIISRVSLVSWGCLLTLLCHKDLWTQIAHPINWKEIQIKILLVTTGIWNFFPTELPKEVTGLIYLPRSFEDQRLMWSLAMYNVHYQQMWLCGAYTFSNLASVHRRKRIEWPS